LRTLHSMRKHRIDALFFTQVYFGFRSAPLFWKLLVSEFLLGISEMLHCSVSAPRVKIVPLLDVHQLLMLFAETLTYSEPGIFSSVIYYNML
jgi:hypothetical protein